MSILDNWSGEKNATAVDQEDNAYVSKSEHDELVKIEEYRKQWADIDNGDWKAIKQFIDTNIASTTFQKFILSAEKKQAGLAPFKMPPLTYYKWQVIQGRGEYKSLASFVTELIDRVYEQQSKIDKQ